jgi:hypothetical protein
MLGLMGAKNPPSLRNHRFLSIRMGQTGERAIDVV